MKLRPSFLLLVALPLAAQQPAAEKPPDRCSVKGVVLKAGTDDPLRRTVVRIDPSEDGSRPYQTTTDAEGRFEIMAIEPGRYSFQIEREGYLLQKIGVGKVWASRPDLQVTLIAGQEVKVVAYMIPGAVVTGRILDAEGEPLSRIVVEALRPHTRGHGHSAYSAETNDLGEYRIHGVRPGRYYLRAQPGWQRRRTVASSAAASAVADDVHVFVPTFYPGVTERSQATPVELVAGQETRADLLLAPVRAVRVLGHVVGTKGGKIEPQSAVTLLQRGGNFYGPDASAAVLEDGTFEIEAVVPGSYLLVAYADSMGSSRVFARQRVEVGDAGVDDLVLAFTPSSKSSIGGRVQIEGAPQAVLRDFQVYASLDPPDEDREFPFYGAGFHGSAGIKPDGTFTITEQLQDGRYRINVHNQRPGGSLDDVYLKSATVAGRDVLRNRLWVSQGTIGGALELVLSTAGARIEGSVLTQSQKPAVSVRVAAVPDEKRRDFGIDYQFQMTDQNGRFVMRGVQPGDYKLFAWEGEGEFFDYRDPDLLQQYKGGGGVPVTVKENDRKTVELKAVKIDEVP